MSRAGQGMAQQNIEQPKVGQKCQNNYLLWCLTNIIGSRCRARRPVNFGLCTLAAALLLTFSYFLVTRLVPRPLANGIP